MNEIIVAVKGRWPPNVILVRVHLHKASLSSTLPQVCMTLAILFSLKAKEWLQNGVVTHFVVTALFLIRPVSIVSSQHCRSIPADAQCKRALKQGHIISTCSQKIFAWIYMSHFSYACKTEGENGMSCLISENDIIWTSPFPLNIRNGIIWTFPFHLISAIP